MVKTPFSVPPKHRQQTEANSRLSHFVPMCKMVSSLLCMIILLIGALASWGTAGVLVIGHQGLEPMNNTLLRRIYTGRVVHVQGQAIQPVNLKSGNSSRVHFVGSVIKQNDDDYVAYWIVRRAIGKGLPPLELDNDAEVVDFVRSNPGAIGYVDATTPVSEVKVLLSLP